MYPMVFQPGEQERFLGCCGGSRRWELTCNRQEWFWELGTSWGQAHIADLVVPFNSRVRLRIDVTNSGALEGSVHFVRDLRVGRLGIDGLPFRSDVGISVSLGRGRLVAQGGNLVETTTWPVPEAIWNDGPTTLCVDFVDEKLALRLGGLLIGETNRTQTGGFLLMVSGRGKGAGKPGPRFGEISVERNNDYL